MGTNLKDINLLQPPVGYYIRGVMSILFVEMYKHTYLQKPLTSILALKPHALLLNLFRHVTLIIFGVY